MTDNEKTRSPMSPRYMRINYDQVRTGVRGVGVALIIGGLTATVLPGRFGADPWFGLSVAFGGTVLLLLGSIELKQ